MIHFKEYRKVQSLEEAYELNQKKRNQIVGGMLWLKMSDKSLQTAIDLSGLGLDQIEETADEFRIGCMVTLRQLELHRGLNEYTQGAMRESVRSIVGVQFRNLATIGGSIFGRYGFSDVLTQLLALDARVELYKAGSMPLAEFAVQKADNDVLVRIVLPKQAAQRSVYASHRNTKTDFPVLTCAMSVNANAQRAKIAIGARPGRARVIEIESEALTVENAAKLAAQFTYGSNMRAGAAYRAHLAQVLIRRSIEALTKEEA